MHAPGERQPRLPTAQALARQVDGHQRGGLAGVDGQGGAAQAEGVGDPVGDHAAVQPGEGVPRDRLGAAGVQQLGVVVRDRPHEDARVWPSRRSEGTTAPSSRASQQSSSASRCWGSIAAASRGEMRKKAGSKRSICSRKPPKRAPGGELLGG